MELKHTHATIPERVVGDPCASSFVGHFDDLTPLPTNLNHTVVGAVDFEEAGIYLVAAFVATGDDALAAFHTILVGEACVAAEAVPHCEGEGRRPSTACEGFFPSATPDARATTTPAPMSGSRGARTSSGGDGGGPKGTSRSCSGCSSSSCRWGWRCSTAPPGAHPHAGAEGAAPRRPDRSLYASGTTDCACVEHASPAGIRLIRSLSF